MLHFRVIVKRGLVGLAATVAVVTTLGAQADKKPLPLKYVGPATVPAITAGDLMTRLYKYADDSMMGRAFGTTGNLMSTAYIESEVRRLGLVPAGDDGGYFQNVGGPMNYRALDPASTITVDGTVYRGGVDFSVTSPGRPIQLANAQVIYAGLSFDTMNVLTPEQVQGKLLLMRPGTPPRITNQAENTAYQQTAGAQAYSKMLAAAAGTISIAPDRNLSASARGALNPPRALTGPVPDRDTKITFTVGNRLADALLGASAADAAKGTLGKSVTSDIRYNLRPSSARNVVAILPGSDPKLKGEYIAIGAHNDHIGYNLLPADHDSVKAMMMVAYPQGADDPRKPPTPEQLARVKVLTDSLHTAHGGVRLDSISNGADDDGSGTVSVLEIAEAFAKGSIKPKRSILFVWHTGEESGMVGSSWFMEHPTVSRDSIVAQLNIDMVGRGEASDATGTAKDGGLLHGNPNYVQLVGSRRLSTELGDLVESTNTKYKIGIQFDYNIDADGHPQNIYCRSDHWSYGKWGVPVVFFTTGGHADYHQITDEPQYIQYGHMARIDQLIFDIAVEAANLDHRLVVDHPKPNPLPATTCKQ